MSDTECEVQNFSMASAVYASTSTSSEGLVGEQQVPTILKGKYFSIVAEKCNDKSITGLCRFCLPKQKEIKGQISSSSNFRSHLKRKHSKEFEEYCSETTAKKRRTFGSREEPAKGSQKQFELDVARYVIHSMIPLRSVDDPYFRQIFINLGLGATINTISRRKLGRIVNQLYVDDITHLKNELETVEFVCTTADIWSGRRRSFFGVTVHWISPSLQRKSAALACRRFSGVHCYDKIKDLLLNVHAEFGLNRDKIVATITDNASNFAKAFKTFGVKESLIMPENEDFCTSLSCPDSSSEEEEEEDEEEEESAAININCITPLLPRHIRCSAHTLNLCITSDMMQLIKKNNGLSTLHGDVMQKCNMLWKAAIKPKSAEIIERIIGRTLKRPGETRWNSLYDSLQHITQIKGKINELGKHLGFKSTITEMDFSYLEEHLQCTAPIAEAIDILQGDNVFYGTLLPYLVTLRNKLTRIAESDLKFCKAISICLLDSLKTRFEKYFDFFTPEADYAALAALTHPKFKNRWLGCIPEYHRNRLLDLLKDTVTKEIRSNTDYIVNTPPTLSNEDRFFEFDNGIVEAMAAGYSSIAELEVLHFFQEGSTEYFILNKYPALKKVFLKYNTPLPSSAPVERLFSYATMTNSPKCNRLSDNMFERRVILKV